MICVVHFTPSHFGTKHLGTPLEKIKQIYFQGTEKPTKVVCAVSKEYPRATEIEYWYGFTPAQKAFLSSSEESYIAYGCGSPEKIILIPFDAFHPYLKNMLTTPPTSDESQFDKIRHFHVYIYEKNSRFYLAQSRISSRIEVTQYLIS
jgi:hypothetical protein